MSNIPPRIGLSNSKLDAEIQNHEIDHDFFDNPCAISDNEMSDFKTESDIRSSSSSLEKGHCENSATGGLRLNFDMTRPLPTGNDLVTPTRQIFSAGQLLNDEVDVSGPHSSYFDMLDRTSYSRRDIHEQEAQKFGTVQQQSRGRLFDLSSSSSDSDSSEAGLAREQILDSDDEGIVELLGKYYEYIDLGDSENSDLTQVSPISSFTDNLPFFSIPSDTNPDHSDPVYKTDYNKAEMGRNQRCSLPQTKPLPPLIIHTLEEVPIIRPQPARYAQHGFNLPQISNSFPASLLMKVEGGEEDTPNSMKTNSSSSSLHTESVASASSCPSSYANNKFKHDINEQLRRKITDHSKNHQHHGLLSHVKGSIHHHRFSYNHQPLKSSATIARQRQQRRIDHENSILVRRLQCVKPSKEIVEAFRNGTSNLKCT